MPDPVLAALKALAGDSGHPLFSAIGWDAGRKVLSFRQHGDDWVNLWLEPPAGDGAPIAEPNNGPASGTVILWAIREDTHRLLEQQGHPGVESLRARLAAAGAMIDAFPEALLNAGADAVIEEAWEDRIEEWREDGTFTPPRKRSS